MKQATIERNVRVTIECKAHQLTSTGSIIRLDLDTSHNDAYPVLLDTTLPNVTVEDIKPGRVWTDNDLVAGLGGITYLRAGGRWFGRDSDGVAYGPHADEDMSMADAAGHLTILWYQAGEK